MAQTIVRILDINPGSDGDGRKWPKHTYTRNDGHYRERVATNHWIKDLPGGPEPNVTYRLNKLPNGYAGFEKLRPDGERIDYFIYGHPNGRFDSIKKFYPHFKHLMDFGGSAGCTCELCMGGSGNGKKRSAGGIGADSRNGSGRSTTPPQRSRFFTKQSQQRGPSDAPAPNLISPFQAKPRGRPPKHGHPPQKSPELNKRRHQDCEGTPDVYESMMAELKEVGPGGVIDRPVEERMSPDWRSGSTLSKDLFKSFQDMPRYVPRIGEIVLFVRKLDVGEVIAWDSSTQTFRCWNQKSKEWLEQPKWEAGVVTQMPQEAVSDQDLFTDIDKEKGVNYSGFRVEPLPEPGSKEKVYTRQYKHIPLHLIRPFIYWQECLRGVAEKDYHPTIRHALMVTSSLCVVERYRFRGTWPNATVFARGVYIGSELIMIGDIVRLLPRLREQREDTVTDIMEITAIRLRFVNLDREDDDISSEPPTPYQMCLHISGHVYTADPSRSLDGVGKMPIDPASGILPAGLSQYGQWFHYSDPSKSAARVEMPYTRILGRCFDSWFGVQPPTSGKLARMKSPVVKEDATGLSRGLKGHAEARQYSLKHDKRIKTEEGKTWFWADTRIEQLDLREVNGRYVGAKRERTQEEMRKLRTVLKALDGKKGGLEEYHAATKAVKEPSQLSSSTYGMVAASRQVGTESPGTTDAENLMRSEDEDEEDDEEPADAMEVEEEEEEEEELNTAQSSDDDEEAEMFDAEETPGKNVETINLIESDDEDDRATLQLAEELARKIRSNDPRSAR